MADSRVRLVLVAAVVAVTAALPSTAAAVQIDVTTTDDGSVGGCSLREAVDSANEDGANGNQCTDGSGPDVINLGSNNYQLSQTGAGENLNATGDIDITSDVTIKGVGATTVIDATTSGDRAFHVFNPLAPPVVEFRDLKIQNSHAPTGGSASSPGVAGDPGDVGGAIYCICTLTVRNVTMDNNSAGQGGEGATGTLGTGTAGGKGGAGGVSGSGGAIYAQDAPTPGASLTVIDSTFTNNFAGAGGGGGKGGDGDTAGGKGGGGGNGGDGGAIFSEVPVSITGGTFADNRAGSGGAGGDGGAGAAGQGGDGGNAGTGGGGGAVNALTTITVNGTTFNQNSSNFGGDAGATGMGTSGVPEGGQGANGGPGGAIRAAAGATITNAVFTDNSTAYGGNGGDPAGPATHRAGAGGNGGALAFEGSGTRTITSTRLTHNHTGRGGMGASDKGGDGGAAWVQGNVTITDSTLDQHFAGSGGDGGTVTGDGGSGGALAASNATLSVVRSTLSNNGAGSAGTPGTGETAGAGGDGGALVIDGTSAVEVVNSTLVQNGAGSPGGEGGGLSHRAGTLVVSASTIAFNTGVGIQSSATSNPIVETTILSSNSPDNCTGTIADAGFNISSSGGGCPNTFSSESPLLDSLALNGGSTETMALGDGSAAVDKIPAGHAQCKATDQRGIPRPRGAGCDIGSFEARVPVVVTGAASSITQTGAKVGGTVNPDGLSTTYHFEYGPDVNYGGVTTETAAGSGASPKAVAATLSGLDPSTTNHYRLVAVNAEGTTNGPDKTFKTAAVPKPPAFKGVKVLTKNATAKKGKAKIKLSCPAATAGSCAGKLSLFAKIKVKGVTKNRRIGRKAFSIQPGKSAKVPVKLSKRARAKLKAKGKLKTTAKANAHDVEGAVKLTSGKVTLNR